MPTLATSAQVNGGSQSFNAVCVMRNLVRNIATYHGQSYEFDHIDVFFVPAMAQGVLGAQGRWMRMFTIPNQSSVPKAWTEFDDDNRMKVRLGTVAFVVRARLAVCNVRTAIVSRVSLRQFAAACSLAACGIGWWMWRRSCSDSGCCCGRTARLSWTGAPQLCAQHVSRMHCCRCEHVCWLVPSKGASTYSPSSTRPL
jgi:hypothetical protein